MDGKNLGMRFVYNTDAEGTGMSREEMRAVCDKLGLVKLPWIGERSKDSEVVNEETAEFKPKCSITKKLIRYRW